MSVTLRKRKNSDGTVTPYLDIYDKGKRTYEFLSELKLRKPSTADDRKYNADRLKIAQKVLAQRMQEVSDGAYNVVADAVALAWMDEYIKSYQKKDKRNIEGVKSRFADYLKSIGKEKLLLKDITETIVINFKDRLINECKGEGAKSYFARFKKIIRQAHREELILKNPAADVNNPGGKARIKDVLTIEEIQLLASTPCQSDNIKYAFLFCCLTGLRWSDITALKWEHIKNGSIIFRQEKTQEDLSVQLNQSAKNILDKLNSEGLIFTLPSANGANKTLQAWVNRAKIPKKITWHCARHSFGTNMLYHGADVFATSKLLGHSSLKHTQRYIRAAEDLKQQAVNKLPDISL